MNFDFLAEAAKEAMAKAYAPYSGYYVGAALLSEDGKVYTGCNIENSAYSPTNCAERTAFFKAVSEGERAFSAIAVAGGYKGEVKDIFPPCGVCRQVMMEFCDPHTFKIILVHDSGYEEKTLSELLPLGFDSAKK
ncbi:MAG: cytidine deaminase [Ruminococcaceae bacterium]|nr:cytidine deaminase [Oscillospiraceae bacterium]